MTQTQRLAASGDSVPLDVAAARHSISTRTLRRMIAAGQLPAYRLGTRTLRVRLEDVDALLRPIPTAGP